MRGPVGLARQLLNCLALVEQHVHSTWLAHDPGVRLEDLGQTSQHVFACLVSSRYAILKLRYLLLARSYTWYLAEGVHIMLCR